MSAIFPKPPRKPLTPEQVEANRHNAARAKAAMASYDKSEDLLRARIETDFGVKFEADADGHWYVDDQQVMGEFDFDRFTDSEWIEYRMWKSITEATLERMTIRWPDVTPKDSSPIEDTTQISDGTVRFKQV